MVLVSSRYKSIFFKHPNGYLFFQRTCNSELLTAIRTVLAMPNGNLKEAFMYILALLVGYGLIITGMLTIVFFITKKFQKKRIPHSLPPVQYFQGTIKNLTNDTLSPFSDRRCCYLLISVYNGKKLILEESSTPLLHISNDTDDYLIVSLKSKLVCTKEHIWDGLPSQMTSLKNFPRLAYMFKGLGGLKAAKDYTYIEQWLEVNDTVYVKAFIKQRELKQNPFDITNRFESSSILSKVFQLFFLLNRFDKTTNDSMRSGYYAWKHYAEALAPKTWTYFGNAIRISDEPISTSDRSEDAYIDALPKLPVYKAYFGIFCLLLYLQIQYFDHWVPYTTFFSSVDKDHNANEIDQETNRLTNFYYNKNLRFSLNYPFSWTYFLKVNTVILRPNETPSNVVTIQVVTEANPQSTNLTLPGMISDIRRKIGHDPQLIKSGYVKLFADQQYRGEYFIVTFIDKNILYEQVQFIFQSHLSNQKWYLFSYVAPQKGFEQSFKLVNEIFHTWRIDN